jgi:diguanylate cyclase (GGDEF)-like protein
MPHTAAPPPRAHSAHAPLRRLSAVALSAHAEDELVRAFVHEACGAVAADAVEVLTVPGEAADRSGVPAAAAPPGVAHAAAGARTLALDETQVRAELGTEIGERLQPRSALLVPFGWAGDVRRVAVLVSRAPRVWTPDELLIAETLANQAALGLARLEAEERRIAQAERDRALARAAHALNVSLELDAVLDTLAREACAAVAGDIAGVHLRAEDGGAVATAGHNCPEEWFGSRLQPGDGIAGRVMASGRAVTSSAYESDIAHPAGFAGDGVRSAVGVPMRWNGMLRGVLSVGFGQRRQVTPEDLQALEAIAELAVVACQNAEAYDHARTAASTDALTGLLNHGAMQVRVREEIARAARDGLPLSCVLIDLDDFKQVNDELGHPAGDALLRGVADSLRAEMRAYDKAARYGGDEFVLVLPGTTEQEARVVAERVRDRVGAGLLDGDSDAVGSCCSIGVAAWAPSHTAADLLAAADRALLLAKRTGKGRVAVASSDAEEELERLEQSDASPAAVHALATAIEARDNYATGHSDQVVRLATGVALLLGLTADAVERIGHAALLHDVGKLGIDNEILQKDGTLDDAEWHVMAQHPIIGEGILRRIPQLAPLAPIVRHEHEHWDGTGYPDGLAKTQIPIGSRIILACDAYAAMIASRPYRAALAPDEAIAELRARAGTQFDPQVVEALLDLLGA